MNPFIEAYIHSDLLGKIIFIWLIALSAISWIILIYKWVMTRSAKKHAAKFYTAFQKHRYSPLVMEVDKGSRNPYAELYAILKKYTLEILNKNRKFGQKEESYLSPADLDFVESHLLSGVTMQAKSLDRNLYILSTIVALAPFVGLLGTVWGILTTFTEMQSQTAGSNQLFLGGLSLALATTVIGLIDAIPALIGYNYLKNQVRDFEVDMHSFSNEMLGTVELQYRKVDSH